MKLLLDTHIFLWLNSDPGKYSADLHKVTANGVEQRFAYHNRGQSSARLRADALPGRSVPRSRQFEIKAEYLRKNYPKQSRSLAVLLTDAKVLTSVTKLNKS